ncbi:MAG: IS1634 family transposase [Candidatus Methanoperedens sp.]|nr:IS1634 family transposase [Candidatus Methanoperedens sp.]
MVFIKKNYRRGHNYYTIADGYREGGKVKHRTLLYLGRLDQLTEEKRKKIEAIVRELPEEKRSDVESCLSTLEIPVVKEQGDVELLYKIAEKLCLRQIINNNVSKTAGVDVGTQMTILAINQCLESVALDNIDLWYHHTTLEELYSIPFYNLNTENLCRAMDYIYEPIIEDGRVVDAKDNALAIKKSIVDRLKELFDIKLDALFYDITSTYFEGNGCIIARLGYSRDGKRDKKQILICLVVTKEHRFPIFYNVLEGNISDLKTVAQTLSILQKEFKIEKTLLVLDRGMISPGNLKKLDGTNYDFIGGLKKDKFVKNLILEAAELEKEENRVRDGMNAVEVVTEYKGKNRKFVIYLDKKKTTSVKQERDIKLAEAWKGLNEYALKVNSGKYKNAAKVLSKAKKLTKGVSTYFKSEIFVEDGFVKIYPKKLEKKIALAEKLDGRYVLFSSDLKLSKEEIISAYFDKDGIEKAFRNMKQHGMQPTRNTLLNRVKTRVFVGYLALLLIATLNFILKKAGLDISSERALQYLKWQKKVTLNLNGEIVAKSTVPELEAQEILKKIDSVKII